MDAIEPLTRPTVRGQYDGYLDVAGVAAKSTTETYVAVRLSVDSWRWAGVPIAIRAGKCMPVTATEVTIRFRTPPFEHLRPRPVPAPATRCGSGSGRRSAVGLTVVGKKPGARLATAGRGPRVRPAARRSDMRPYDRLIGAALDGDRCVVRPAGRRRGGLAGGRARARRGHPRPPVRPRQLGAEGSRRAAARR